MRIRVACDADLEDLLRVERLAFRRDDEANLVADLLRDPTALPLLSLLAESEGRCLGHVLFTAVELVGPATPVVCSILAPLAVLPEAQGTGVGRALIEEGCRMLAARGVSLVFVFGSPSYYGRFGFEAANALGLEAPHPVVPVAAWQVRGLEAGVVGRARGTVRPAEALAAEALWRE
jgi:putative acetyltransferase